MAKKTIQQWEDGAFSKILGVTLKITDSKTPMPYYLSSTASDLVNSGSDPLLTTNVLEMALVECLDNQDFLSANANSFTFLFNSWRRAYEIKLNLKGPKGAAIDPQQRELRIQSLDALKQLLISYSGLSLQEDSLFSGDNASALLSIIISSPQDTTDWFNELISRFDNDGLDLITENIVVAVNSSILAVGNIVDGKIFPYIKCYGFLVNIPQVVHHIAKILWFNHGEAKEIETKSVLGPLFSISAFPEEDNGSIANFFNGIESLGRGDQQTTMSTIRTSVSLLQSYQFKIVNTIIRSSKFAREVFLKWAAKTICSNIKRTGLQADPKLSISNGFADNLAFVLLQLCQPFSADSQLSKLNKTNIDIWSYVRVLGGQLDSASGVTASAPNTSEIVKNTWNELTRLCASTEEAQQFETNFLKSIDQSTDLGFISDCFHLTTLAIHVGPLATVSKFNQLGKNVHQLQQHLDSIQATIDNNSNSNPSSNVLMERWRQHLKNLKNKRLAMEANIMDPHKLSTILNFSRFTIGSILSLHQLALSSEINLWKCFPEYMLEDQLSLILFITRYAPDALLSPELSPPQPGLKLLDDLVVALIIAILSQPELVRNPYLKSKLVDVLHSVTYSPPEDDDDYVDTIQSYDSSRMKDTYDPRRRNFIVHPIVSQFISSLNELHTKYLPSSNLLKTIKSKYPTNQLVMVLLKLYIDIEHTGANSAFYDKFSVRYNIARIMRSLWHQPNSQHLKATYNFFESASNASAEIVEQFVSRIVSDTTYLLDESLSKLAKIKSLESGEPEPQADLESSQHSANNPAERQQELERTEREASSYITLAHETVHILAFLTRLIPGPFRSESIIARFAAMLNFNLDLLAGPKCRDLKVKNMTERFQFRPRILLSEILAVYLHLSFPKSIVASSSGVKYQSDNEYFMQSINKQGELAQIEKFINSLAEDQRSWNQQVFMSSLDLCSRLGLKPQQSIQLLSGLIPRVEKSVKQSSTDDLQLGDDIPEEFLDPIMYTLMEDPVLLPTSQTILDFKTIKGYLLTDPRDPFNREPLEISDVVHLPDLKAQIEEFKLAAQQKWIP